MLHATCRLTARGPALRLLRPQDLKLAVTAAEAVGSAVPIGRAAHGIFGQVAGAGWEAKDFGAVYEWLEAGAPETRSE